MSSWLHDFNCLSLISALSNTHLTMSIYGSILGLVTIRCRNEHACSIIDASNDPCESVVALTSITQGFSSSSRLYMPSQVDMPASMVQVVFVNKAPSLFPQQLGLLLSFPLHSAHCCVYYSACRSCKFIGKERIMVRDKVTRKLFNSEIISNISPYVK